MNWITREGPFKEPLSECQGGVNYVKDKGPQSQRQDQTWYVQGTERKLLGLGAVGRGGVEDNEDRNVGRVTSCRVL